MGSGTHGRLVGVIHGFGSFDGIYPPRLSPVAATDCSETPRPQTEGAPDRGTTSDSSSQHTAM